MSLPRAIIWLPIDRPPQVTHAAGSLLPREASCEAVITAVRKTAFRLGWDIFVFFRYLSEILAKFRTLKVAQTNHKENGIYKLNF